MCGQLANSFQLVVESGDIPGKSFGKLCQHHSTSIFGVQKMLGILPNIHDGWIVFNVDSSWLRFFHAQDTQFRPSIGDGFDG